MKHKSATAILTGALGFALAFGLTPCAESKNKPSAKITGQTITATGCLTKEAKEKNENKVTVTGKVTKGVHGNEAGDMNVRDLKMVSDTCK